MEKPKFTYVIHINATPERLWEALTKPEFTYQYWGRKRIQSDWTPGASVKLVKEDGGISLEGEVLRAEPPKVLSYTFQAHDKAGSIREEPTRVTFEIGKALGTTQLTIVHDGFEPGSAVFLEISRGWQAIASSIKTLLETGEALPIEYTC